jgi:hypothetical protein
MGSKYEAEQQAIQQLESQLQSIQLMSLYNRKERSVVDDPTESHSSFIAPSHAATFTPSMRSTPAVAHVTSRLDAAESSDYPFSSSIIRNSPFLAHMRLEEASFHAHEVLHATLCPPSVQAPLASAALTEDRNRSHQLFLVREVQPAAELLHALEGSQILDRVMEQTVNE